jgi:hypothetical protein
LCLPVGTSKCTPVSNKAEGGLVEHFQQDASAVQLGKGLRQFPVRPAVDTNVGISTRLAFSSSISTAVNIGGGARLTRSACVFVGQSELSPWPSHGFVFLELEMHSAV